MMEKKKYDNFTLSLALFDALPVLFFSIAILLIGLRFRNVIFFIGAMLCSLAGCGKVLWKILLAGSGKDFQILNRQMRVLMPSGFVGMIAGLIIGRHVIDFSVLRSEIFSFPAVVFFAITVIGMICMSVFAVKLDGTKAKNNWIEQITNAVAQGCFLAGVLAVIW